jgi:cytochrome c biogenesis protein
MSGEAEIKNGPKNDTGASSHPAPGGFDARLWNFFSSMKLAVILLIVLALVSIIGTVLFQGDDSEDNIRLFTNAVWGVYNKLGMVDANDPAALASLQESARGWGLKLHNASTAIGFDRLYRMWYFNLLLVFLSVNLIVCMLRHWPHTWKFFREPMKTLGGEGTAAMPLRRDMVSRDGVDEATRKAAERLSARGWKAEVTEEGAVRHLFAQKGIWGRLGIYFLHASILIILFGAVIGAWFGRKGFLPIEEGETVDSVRPRNEADGAWKLPFQIRCDDFEVTYYDSQDGSRRPKDFTSMLTVIQPGKAPYTKKVEVNYPLIFPDTFLGRYFFGTYFYQSTYGETGKGRIKLRISDKAGRREPVEVVLDLGKTVEVPGYDMQVFVRGDSTNTRFYFYPDFDFGPENQYTNRSSQPNNPAAVLRFVKRDGSQIDTLLLERYPKINHLAQADFDAQFVEYKGIQYTGLQVAYDPGTWVVWIGCIMMIIGIYSAFFMPHRRVWVRIEAGPKGSSVRVAGSTNKNKLSFESDFEEIVAAVKEGLAA